MIVCDFQSIELQTVWTLVHLSVDLSCIVYTLFTLNATCLPLQAYECNEFTAAQKHLVVYVYVSNELVCIVIIVALLVHLMMMLCCCIHSLLYVLLLLLLRFAYHIAGLWLFSDDASQAERRGRFNQCTLLWSIPFFLPSFLSTLTTIWFGRCWCSILQQQPLLQRRTNDEDGGGCQLMMLTMMMMMLPVPAQFFFLLSLQAAEMIFGPDEEKSLQRTR